jgi:hypothetical protein
MRKTILKIKRHRVKILVIIILVMLILASIPNFLWKKSLPKEVPEEMNDWIKELENTNGKEECLYKAYDLVISKWRGGKYKTYTRFPWLFVSDLDKIWNQDSKFMHCMTFNYIMRILLIESGCFNEEDINQ